MAIRDLLTVARETAESSATAANQSRLATMNMQMFNEATDHRDRGHGAVIGADDYGVDRGGALAGGGAVAGLVVLGTPPALASVAIMHHALRPDDDLPRPERSARTARRIGTAVGAVAGSAGSVATVSALGVPGLGAAGFSSGLAAAG